MASPEATPAPPADPVLWVLCLETNNAGDVADKASNLGKLIDGLGAQKLNYKITSSKKGETKSSLIQVGASFSLLLHMAEVREVRLRLKDGRFRAFEVARFHDFAGAADPQNFLHASAVQRMVTDLLGNITDKVHEGGWPLRAVKGIPLIAQMEESKQLKTTMVLHDEGQLEALIKEWAHPGALLKGWDQPLSAIRHYYGARVALYFAFLGYYTAFLAFPAVAGLGLYAYRQRTGTLDNLPTVVYSLLVPVWATVMLEMWKRYRTALVHDWGLLEDEHETQPKAKILMEVQAASKTSWLSSLLTTAMMLTLIATCAVGTFLFEFTSPCADPPTQWTFCPPPDALGGQAQLGATILHAVGYVVFGMVMIEVSKAVGTKLNDREHHVDDQAKENALLAKIFPAYFVVSYITLFYYAFWLRDMTKLRAWMAKLLIIKQIQSFAQEVIVPLIVSGLLPKVVGKFKKGPKDGEGEGKAEADARTGAEKLKAELGKPVYDESDTQEGLFDDYLEICFQFGYVVLFSAAYPLAGLMAFINNLVEIRSDAFKVCRLVRRPRARRALSMGVWIKIFEVMGFVSVITNCAIIGFVSTELNNMDLQLLGVSPGVECAHGASLRGRGHSKACEDVHLLQKMAVVFIIEHALLLAKYLLMRSSEVPTLRMAEQMAHQEEYDLEMIAEKAKKRQ